MNDRRLAEAAGGQTGNAGLTDKEAKEQARFYSTKNKPDVGDFEWFSKALSSGKKINKLFKSDEIITNPLALDGNWKAYMVGNPNKYHDDVYRYLNVNIKTLSGKIKLTLNWWMLYDETGEAVDEGSFSEPVECTGTWSDDRKSAVLNDSSANIKMFVFAEKNSKQYAIGNYVWPSGENDYLVLVRP